MIQNLSLHRLNDLAKNSWLGNLAKRSARVVDWESISNQVVRARPNMELLADSDLRNRYQEICNQRHSQTQDKDDEAWVVAASLADESVARNMGFRPHDVQIRGAIACASGTIIEMQTGEGKTIVTAMAAIIRSIFDQSVHVATTTDYLAERDHESVVSIFNTLGIRSAILTKDAQPAETREAYQSKIVYGPGYLFGFDYLRDQIELRDAASTTLGREVLEDINGTDFRDSLRQQGHHSIIIDEADSVLIDEATTPLILSGAGEIDECSPAQARVYQFAKFVSEELTIDDDFEVDPSEQRVSLSDRGKQICYERLRSQGRVELDRPWEEYIQNALYAEHFLARDEHYVVLDDSLALVDQMTGRIFDDRTLRGGLQQAVEAKEGIPIQPPNNSIARITRQRFFQLYDCVCGLTGTARGSEAELNHFYATDVVPLEPHRPSKRVETPMRFFIDWDHKLIAVVKTVQEMSETGRPILIGTRTIDESKRVFDAFVSAGIDCTILNGVQDADEASIVATAGNEGSVMIATNMAGRGTDIKLTEKSRELGGLHVLATSCNRSTRVDRQLAGRSARQGDPGSCEFFVSADDDLFNRFCDSLRNDIAQCASTSENGECDAKSASGFQTRLYQLQQLIERHEYEIRRKLVRHDKWMDTIRHAMVAE